MVSRLFLQFLHLTNTRPATSFLSSMFHLQHNLLTQYSVFEKMSLEMFFKILFQPFRVLPSCYLKLEQRINKIIIQWYHNYPMNKSCLLLLKQFLRAHCCLIITSAKPHPDPESSTPATKATAASKYFLAVNKYFCEQTILLGTSLMLTGFLPRLTWIYSQYCGTTPLNLLTTGYLLFLLLWGYITQFHND